jgi:hypothetical protein
VPGLVHGNWSHITCGLLDQFPVFIGLVSYLTSRLDNVVPADGVGAVHVRITPPFVCTADKSTIMDGLAMIDKGMINQPRTAYTLIFIEPPYVKLFIFYSTAQLSNLVIMLSLIIKYSKKDINTIREYIFYKDVVYFG